MTTEKKEWEVEYRTILNIIADIAPDEDTSSLEPKLRLRDQLDLDSMDFLDIVMELRKEYGVEVPEEHYPYLATLDSAARYVHNKRKDPHYTPDYESPLK